MEALPLTARPRTTTSRWPPPRRRQFDHTRFRGSRRRPPAQPRGGCHEDDRCPPRRPAAEKSPSTTRHSVPGRRKPAPPTVANGPRRLRHYEADDPEASPRHRSHVTARPRSTTPTRQRRSDPISQDTERGLLSRSVEAVIAWLKNQVHRLMDALRERGETVTQNIRQKFREWMDTLVDTIAQSDAGIDAAIAGIRAALTGKSPVWAAIKALVSGLSGKAKVALVLVLVLGPCSRRYCSWSSCWCSLSRRWWRRCAPPPRERPEFSPRTGLTLRNFRFSAPIRHLDTVRVDAWPRKAARTEFLAGG